MLSESGWEGRVQCPQEPPFLFFLCVCMYTCGCLQRPELQAVVSLMLMLGIELWSAQLPPPHTNSDQPRLTLTSL